MKTDPVHLPSTNCHGYNRPSSQWFRSLVAILVAAAGALTLQAQDDAPSVRVVPIGAKIHQTEHCLFIVEDDGKVAWPDANSVFSQENLARYFNILTTQFPGTYDSVCFLANHVTPNNAPIYVTRKFKATGINSPGTPGAPQSFASVDYCCYGIDADPVTDDCLRDFDHQIGHAWGVFIANQDADHWWDASTVDCQMGGGTFSAPTFLKKIYGNPVSGFRWRAMDVRQSDHQQTYSEQQLYLMGLQPTLPAFHVFNSPVFNADHTLGFASATTFNHANLLAALGPRTPDYKQSPKKFKVAFVYIARSEAEIYNDTFYGAELAIMKFCDSEDLNWGGDYDSLVPFLCGTRFRASVDSVLADLDGNRRPQITIIDPYVASTDGTATVRFTASDPDGPVPTVSIVPYSGRCTIQGSTVQIAGLPDGVHFFTLRAQDTAGKQPFGYWNRGGKKVYGHFVVEVKRSAAAVSFTTQPTDRTVTACAPAVFAVAASGSPVSFQWFLQAAGTSTWNALSEGNGYAGTTTTTLTVTTSVTMDGDRFLCTANNGAATSDVATLVVIEQAPIVTMNYSHAGSSYRIGDDSGPVCFSVFGGGPPKVTGYCTYQWQRKPSTTGIWANVAGGSNGQLWVNVQTMDQNGDQYRCVVTNTSGSTTSVEETLTALAMPVATVSPTQLTAWAGESASFKVSVTGTGPFTYQWFRAGKPVAGATSDTLTFAKLAGDEGSCYYTVVATNAVASASAVCWLDLHIPLPTVTAPPADRAVTRGASASFSVGATSFGFPGFGFLNFMWERKAVGTGVWVSVDNQFRVTPGLSVSNTTLAMNGDQYRCVVANQEGWTYSPPATLSVTAPADSIPQAPVISSQPATAADAVLGGGTTFSVVATGTPALSYQWQRKPAATGVWANVVAGGRFTGITTATLIIGSTAAPMNGDQFRCIVTNTEGSVTSTAGMLNVLQAPVISSQPETTADAVFGGGTTFSVVATGTPAVSYQWQRKPAATGVWANVVAGGRFTGITTATLIIGTTAAPMNGDQFRCIVTNTQGSVTSTAGTLNVLQAPVISSQPETAADAVLGGGTAFSVVATGMPTLTYQWQRKPAATGVWGDVVAGGRFTGITTATLIIGTTAAPMNGDQFRCIVTNTEGSVTSAAGTLNVLQAPVISSQPETASDAVLGGGTTFSVFAIGNPTLSYQWQRKPAATGVWANVVAGGRFTGINTATLIIGTTAAPMNGDQFRCIVTNTQGSVTSTPGTLNVQ